MIAETKTPVVKIGTTRTKVEVIAKIQGHTGTRDKEKNRGRGRGTETEVAETDPVTPKKETCIATTEEISTIGTYVFS